MIEKTRVDSVVFLNRIPINYFPLYLCLEKMVLASFSEDAKEVIRQDIDFIRMYKEINKNDSNAVYHAFGICRRLCLISLDKSLSYDTRKAFISQARNTFNGFPIPDLI